VKKIRYLHSEKYFSGCLIIYDISKQEAEEAEKVHNIGVDEYDYRVMSEALYVHYTLTHERDEVMLE
jgi:hypothetical protein